MLAKMVRARRWLAKAAESLLGKAGSPAAPGFGELEPLESRQLLSSIAATAGDDAIVLRLKQDQPGTIQVLVNGSITECPAGEALAIDSGLGADSVTLDCSNGNLLAANAGVPITLANPGTDTDALAAAGASAATAVRPLVLASGAFRSTANLGTGISVSLDIAASASAGFTAAQSLLSLSIAGAVDASAVTLTAAAFTLTGGSLTTASTAISPGGSFTQSGGLHHVLSALSLAENYTLAGGTLKVGTEAAPADEYLNHAGTARFLQTGGEHIITRRLYLGSWAGGYGDYRIEAGELSVGDIAYVGYAGSGSITQTGGEVAIAGTLSLGQALGSSGTYDLAAGSLRTGTLLLASGLGVAGFGQGTFLHSGGLHTVTGAIWIGSYGSAVGRYELSGLGDLRVSGDTYIGWSGRGVFEQSGGSHQTGGSLVLGRNSGASGEYWLSGGLLDAANAYVGQGSGATGLFEHSGGTFDLSGGLSLGWLAGSTGTYRLSAGGVLSSAGVTVGFNGTGTFIQSGGTNAITGGLILGYNAGSSGRYEVRGGQLTVSSDSFIGRGGEGAFIQTGGTHAATNLRVSVNAGSIGAYELWGGSISVASVILAPGGPATFVHGLADLTATTSVTLGAQTVYDCADSSYLHTPTLTQLAGSVYRHIPAPALPASFAARLLPDRRVELSWPEVTANATPYSQYVLEQFDADAMEWVFLAELAGSASSYTTVESIPAGGVGRFRLRADDDFGRSSGYLVRSTGPAGAKAYSLSDGFAIEPFATFAPASPGNYISTDEIDATATDIWADQDGIAHTVVTTTTSTLVVTVTEGTDGTWTYSESLTAVIDIEITPILGGAGVSTLRHFFDQYTFSASGNAAISTFTFVAESSESGSGDLARVWQLAGGSFGNITRPLSVSGSHSAQISSTTDLTTGVVIGTSLLSGSSTFTSSSSTGPYTCASNGGTVTGTITVSESHGSSYAYTESGGSFTEFGQSGTTYSGSGTYSCSDDGVAVSGTITESGNSGMAYGSTTLSTYGGGAWADTGSGWSRFYGSDDWSYSGGGSYSRDTASGWIGGTVTESGSEGSSYDYTTVEALGLDGDWRSVSGTGGGSSDGHDDWSYEGDGWYSCSFDGGAVTGTIDENGSEGWSYQYDWDEELDSQGEWRLVSGSGWELSDSDDASSYAGSGSYSYETAGGSVDGTIDESGGEGWISHYRIDSTVVSGDWSDSGSGWGRSWGNDDSSYVGSGSYWYACAGGSVSGTIDEDGGEDWSYEYNWNEALGSDGSWGLTSGSGWEIFDEDEDWSYLGSGFYSYEVSGGSVNGTINESGSEGGLSSYRIDSTVVSGQWVDVGTGGGSSHGDDDWSYGGSGAYYYAVPGGSVDGTIDESGGEGWAYAYEWDEELDLDGEWQLTFGVGWETSDGDEEWSYLGDGAYAYATTGGSVAGTIDEGGSEGWISHYRIDSSVIGGAWVDVGTGGGSSHGDDDWSYLGEGTYSYTFPGGSVGGDIDESGCERWAYEYEWDEELDSEGEWQLTLGSGWDNSHADDDWSCLGAGAYGYLTTGGSAGGTIAERGSKGWSVTRTITSSVVDGAWVDVDAGGGESHGDDDWSYTGGGTYSYSFPGGSVAGTISEHGSEGGSYAYEWDEELDSDGLWHSTWGGGHSDAYGDDDWSYTGDGAYSYATTGGLVGGTIEESGRDGWDYEYQWDEDLDIATGLWLLSGGGGQDRSYGQDDWSYSGTGDYAQDMHDGTMAGTITESGSEGWSGTRLISSGVVDGQWVDVGTGWGDSYGDDEWSYLGGGAYSSAGPHGGTVTGTMQQSGREGWSYGYGWDEEFDPAGDLWHLSGGSGTSEEHDDDDFSWSGGGSYAYTPYVGDGEAQVSGTITDAGNSSERYSFNTSSLVDEQGQWVTTGSGSTSRMGEDELSWSGGGTYSRTVNDYVTATGTITDGGRQGGSHAFSTTAILFADESLEVTGSGTSEVHQDETFSWTGGGTFSGSGAVVSGDGESTTITTTDSSFSESGSFGSWSGTAITWTRDGDGWRETEDVSSQGGHDRGGYTYGFEQTRDTTTLSGSQTVSDWDHVLNSVSESFDYGFERTLTVSTASDGTESTSGEAAGGGWAIGSGSHESQWEYASPSTLDSYSESSLDACEYLEEWTEETDAGGTRGAFSGVNQVSGSSEWASTLVWIYSDGSTQTFPDGGSGSYDYPSPWSGFGSEAYFAVSPSPTFSAGAPGLGWRGYDDDGGGSMAAGMGGELELAAMSGEMASAAGSTPASPGGTPSTQPSSGMWFTAQRGEHRNSCHEMQRQQQAQQQQAMAGATSSTRSSLGQAAAEFLGHAAAGWAESNGGPSMPAPRTNVGTAGRLLGRIVALGQGVSELVGGAGAMVGGAGVSTTGLGAPAGVLAIGGGKVAAGHGVWVIGNTLKATFGTPLGFQKQDGPNSDTEQHHLLPVEFEERFRAKGLDIEEYKIPLPATKHRLKPDGIHTGRRADSWNGRWRDFFENNPDPTREQILEKLTKLREEFGI